MPRPTMFVTVAGKTSIRIEGDEEWMLWVAIEGISQSIWSSSMTVKDAVAEERERIKDQEVPVTIHHS